jgi:hypothetical protein
MLIRENVRDDICRYDKLDFKIFKANKGVWWMPWH